MALKKVSEYWASCEHCPNVFVYHGWRIKDALKEAREDGWKIGTKNICPKCKVIRWQN